MIGTIRLKPLLASLFIALGVGALAGIITMDSMEEYSSIANQPSFAPPGWLFPVVWSILYILMGIAAYIVYVSSDENKTTALIFYGVQLALNFLWPILFFGANNYLLAFIELIILWIAVIVTTVLFFRVKPAAGYLMIPYILWLTFAGILNLSIYVLNR